MASAGTISIFQSGKGALSHFGSAAWLAAAINPKTIAAKNGWPKEKLSRPEWLDLSMNADIVTPWGSTMVLWNGRPRSWA